MHVSREGEQMGQGKGKRVRIFGSENALCLVGIACVVYGLLHGLKLMQVFFGVCIIGGSFLLRMVRTKDWDAHWAEMDRVRQAQERRMAEENEKKKQ